MGDRLVVPVSGLVLLKAPGWSTITVVKFQKSFELAGVEPTVSCNRRFRMACGKVWTNPGPGNPDILGPAGPIDPEVGVLGAWLTELERPGGPDPVIVAERLGEARARLEAMDG